jgi:pSer/pThr/pTyr-binding forkhead associated (FHA) protein
VSATGTGWLVAVGTAGLSRGEAVLLRVGQAAVLGRGEGSTIPLSGLPAYRALSADAAALRAACQGVSRRHLRLEATAEGECVVEDLSRSGTFVDGLRIETRVHLRDLRDRSHEIRFGPVEVLEVRWAAAPGGAGA